MTPGATSCSTLGQSQKGAPCQSTRNQQAVWVWDPTYSVAAFTTRHSLEGFWLKILTRL